jgi:hypothetical protein
MGKPNPVRIYRMKINEYEYEYEYEYRCPKKIVPFSKIFLWAPDVMLESFLYQVR